MSGLDTPANKDLSRIFAQSLSHFVYLGIIDSPRLPSLVVPKRRVGLKQNTLLFAEVGEFGLLKIRVFFDLICSQNNRTG